MFVCFFSAHMLSFYEVFSSKWRNIYCRSIKQVYQELSVFLLSREEPNSDVRPGRSKIIVGYNPEWRGFKVYALG